MNSKQHETEIHAKTSNQAQQRAELDTWKAKQLTNAPKMDEATARRISAALFGTSAKLPKAKSRQVLADENRVT